MATASVEKTTSLFGVDRPAKHDIEAVRPHIRKHMRAFPFVLKNGSEVLINGTGYKDALKRLDAMALAVSGIIPALRGGR
ncbi:MAG: hypothetical protein FWD68_08505 [Alphaproteobacteria bacterium]|nr:hypothetical protein [Alphaproteobacteria bacterium]